MPKKIKILATLGPKSLNKRFLIFAKKKQYFLFEIKYVSYRSKKSY